MILTNKIPLIIAGVDVRGYRVICLSNKKIFGRDIKVSLPIALFRDRIKYSYRILPPFVVYRKTLCEIVLNKDVYQMVDSVTRSVIKTRNRPYDVKISDKVVEEGYLNISLLNILEIKDRESKLANSSLRYQKGVVKVISEYSLVSEQMLDDPYLLVEGLLNTQEGTHLVYVPAILLAKV